MRNFSCLLFATLLCTAVSAQNYNSDKLKQKCQVLRRFLEQNHYQPVQWNDSSSHLLFDKWIDKLDKEKRYFIKADIDELNTFRNRLGDEMLGKGWEFFNKSTALYKMRLQQVDSIVKAILSKPLDFSKPDNLQWPFTSYATSVQELTQRWQQITKWRVLDRILDEDDDSLHQLTTKTPDNFSTLELKETEKIKRQQTLLEKKRLQPSSNFERDLEDDYLDAICWCYDPHTEYMDMAAKKKFDTELSNFEYSVGMDVEKNDKGEWQVSKLIPGGSAWRNGDIHQGDILLRIKVGDNQEENLEDLNEEQIAILLQGMNADILGITLKTSNGSEKVVTLAKEKVEDDESIVKSFVLEDSAKIGYIKLPGFYLAENEEKQEDDEGCANDVAKEVVKLKEDSIKGLILDLRFNGGGSMWEALQLAGIFIDIGPLGSTKDKTGKVHFLKDPNRGTIYDGPMLVMVNAESASASELVSAVLQNYNRAIIVGSTTYGKGSEQIVLPLDTTGRFSEKDTLDDFVKITDGKFYRVDGSTTQWTGVVPDISLPDFYIPDKFREKGQRSALLPDNSKPAIYDALPAIPVAQLKKESEARVSVDSNFLEVKKYADWFKQYLAGVSIPLQWPSFFSYSKKIDEAHSVWDKKDEKNVSLIKVINNRFDISKMKFETEGNTYTNDSYLDRIGKDEYIRESYNIIMDWIKLKN